MLRTTTYRDPVVEPDTREDLLDTCAPSFGAPGDDRRFLALLEKRSPTLSNSVMLEVDVFDLIQNAVLLVSVENETMNDVLVTMGIHYSGRWPVSKDLVTTILPRAIRNAMNFAKSFINIAVLVKHDDKPMATRRSCLVIEINDDGPEYSQEDVIKRNEITLTNKEISDVEIIEITTGGVLNGPLLRILVPFDYQTATLGRMGFSGQTQSLSMV